MFTSRMSRTYFMRRQTANPAAQFAPGRPSAARFVVYTTASINLRNNPDLMTALTSPRFLRPRQFGTRRQVGYWSAPLGAVIGDVCARASVAVDVESMTGRSDYGQPKRSTGAGFANGGRTP